MPSIENGHVRASLWTWGCRGGRRRMVGGGEGVRAGSCLAARACNASRPGCRPLACWHVACACMTTPRGRAVGQRIVP
eukprot:9152231-Lingulodinium_polyedra.AAC.1